MKKLNLAHVPAEERQSPGGKYVKAIKEIPDSGKWAVSKESAGYIFAQGTEADYYKDEE